MRFKVFAAAISLIFVGTVFLSWVIGRDITSEDRSPVRSVQGSGQVMDYEVDASCVQFQKPGGDLETICPHSTAPDVDTRLIITEQPKDP